MYEGRGSVIYPLIYQPTENIKRVKQNMVTSKHHKTDEKCTHFAVLIFPSIIGFKIFPLHPEPFQKCTGTFFYMLIIAKLMCTTVFSIVLASFQSHEVLSFDKALVFSLILLYTWLRQVIN